MRGEGSQAASAACLALFQTDEIHPACQTDQTPSPTALQVEESMAGSTQQLSVDR